MSTKVKVVYNEEMSFIAEVNNHKIMLDADEAVGGKNRGPAPKPLTLVSLGGCTGMDVVSILKKMRVAFDSLNIEIEAESTDEHPKTYKSIHLIYHFTGKELPVAKLEKAVNLSQDRYCGVSEMLRKASELSYEIRVN